MPIFSSGLTWANGQIRAILVIMEINASIKSLSVVVSLMENVPNFYQQTV